MQDEVYMNNWAKRVFDNIKPVSMEQSLLKEMLKEWSYNGEHVDLEEDKDNCQLCDHPDIRYQFGITNMYTGHKLLVGSECITRFDLSGIGDEGEYISPPDTRKKVASDRRKLTEEARRKRVINCLLKLAALNENTEFNFESAIAHFYERRKFSPKFMGLIIWQLRKNNISFNLQDFKISLRRGREISQLIEMEDWQRAKIWDVLTESQRDLYYKKLHMRERIRNMRFNDGPFLSSNDII